MNILGKSNKIHPFIKGIVPLGYDYKLLLHIILTPERSTVVLPRVLLNNLFSKRKLNKIYEQVLWKILLQCNINQHLMQCFLSIFENILSWCLPCRKPLNCYVSKMLFSQLFYPLNAIMVCLYFTIMYIFISQNS